MPFVKYVTTTLPVCDCCIIALANADTSGCEYMHGTEHADSLCEFGLDPGEEVVPGEETSPELVRCAGCGDDTVSRHTVEVLTTVSGPVRGS